MKDSIKHYSNLFFCAAAAIYLIFATVSFCFDYATESEYAKILRDGARIEAYYSIAHSEKGKPALVYYTSGYDEDSKVIFSDDELIAKIDKNGETITVLVDESTGKSVPELYKPHTAENMAMIIAGASLAILALAACVISAVLVSRMHKMLRLIGISPDSLPKPKNDGVAHSVFKTKKGFVLGIVWMTVMLVLFGGIFVCANMGYQLASSVCVYSCVSWFLLLMGIIEGTRYKLLRELKSAIDAQASASDDSIATA